MRFEAIHAHAFGPLHGDSLELAPGFTVVHGPNEAGKSSWHAALYAGLCGRRRGPGISAADREFAARHRPWDGDSWEVGATIVLGDGRRIELRHDLDGKVDCAAVDLVLGRPVSDDIVFDGAIDGSRLLGLNRRSLLPTLCVRQADILGVLEDAGQLQEHLQRAASTAGADGSVEQAIQRIDTFRRDHVGIVRRGVTKPRQQAVVQMAAAESALQAAQEAHDDYLGLLAELDEAVKAAGSAERREAQLRAALHRRELTALESRLRRAEQLAVGAEQGPVRCAEQATLDTAAAAVAAYEHRPPEPARLEGPDAAELTAHLEDLPTSPDGDLEPAPEVEAAAAAFHRAQHALELHQAEPPTLRAEAVPEGVGPAELRRLADALDDEPPEVDAELALRIEELRAASTRGPSRPLTAAGIVVLIVGLATIVVGLSTVGALLAVLGLGVLVATVALARRRRPDPQELSRLEMRLAIQEERRRQASSRVDAARRRVSALGLPHAVAELRRVAAAAEEAPAVEARLEAWTLRAERLAQELAGACSALGGLLRQRGVRTNDDIGSLADALAEYRAACRRRSDQAQAAGRRTDLERQLVTRRAAEEAVRQDRDLRQRAAASVRVAAAAVGLDADGQEPDGLVVALRRWQDEQRQLTAAAQVQRENAAALAQLIDGTSIDELRAEVTRRRDALGPAGGGGRGDDVGLADENELERAEKQAQDAREAAATLRGRVADRARSTVSVAEAEEAHARAAIELARVERLDATLETTLALLERARDRVQRDIAPYLATAVSQRLPAVTSGRYREVMVDPGTLQVRVRRAANGRWRQAELLSHGTAEQVYLLLRLAMAECIVGSEPAPFILDDVTVQCDEQRTRTVLELLHTVSRDRQVVLFSQENDVRDWARDHLNASCDRLVTLDGPVSS